MGEWAQLRLQVPWPGARLLLVWGNEGGVRRTVVGLAAQVGSTSSDKVGALHLSTQCLQQHFATAVCACVRLCDSKTVACGFSRLIYTSMQGFP